MRTPHTNNLDGLNSFAEFSQDYLRLAQWITVFFLLMISGILHAAEQKKYGDLEPITMQIRWHHQFQFAGYYAALEKGFYRDVGLDVRIVAGSPERNPVSEVLAGRAQYGEANSELLYHYLQGEPLVSLAAIFQHSPSVLLTLDSSNIHTPQDMIGRKVMMVGGSEDVDFLAMLANEGVSIEQLNIQQSSYNIQDLIDGKTELFNAYLTNEPFYLKERGYQGFAIKPARYGIDFYSDILFTTQSEIDAHPQRVKRFREATIEGWRYAMSHREEIIELLLNKYETKKSRSHLEFEAAAMDGLILPELIPIGNINKGRFEHMAKTMERFNLVRPGYSLDNFFYDPNPQIDLKLFWQVTAVILSLLILAVLTMTVLWRFNKRMHNEIQIRQQVEKDLLQSESHFRTIINNLQDVYYRADTQGNLVAISPSVKDVMGYTEEECIGKNIADYYVAPFTRESFLKALKLANGNLKGYELKILKRDNSVSWVSANSQFIIHEGEVTGVEGTIRDITALKQHQEQYKLMALHDPLTNLPNRRFLLDILQKVMAQNIRRKQTGALLYIDLNKFKPVNDTYGHDAGDHLLVEAAARLASLVREEDTITRVGGDEFIMVLPIMSGSGEKLNSECIAIANKITHALEQPFNLGKDIGEVHIGASIGIATFPNKGIDIDQLIKQADEAMYMAKSSKTTHTIIYESAHK